MKTITKYQSTDGSEWNAPEQAIARDKMEAEVNEALGCLIKPPAEPNWEGFVQQDASDVLECKTMLFQIANQEGVLKWWIDDQLTKHGKTERQLIEDVHPSWFGRMLDGGHGPLGRGYGRMACIDKQYRQWNQPFYAANPVEGAKCVNDA